MTSEGIKQFLERDSRFRVKACFTNWQAFVEKCMRKEDFQIVIFNPAIIQFHSSFNVRDLFTDYPHIYIVALQSHYINENILSNFDGIINIYDKGSLLPNKLLHIIETENNTGMERSSDTHLSKRETDVLVYLAKGLSNKEIAAEMCLSIHTVMSYRKTLVRKTAIKTVAGLTLYALVHNLVSLEALPNNPPHK
jgi:DNA-binding NarL/FixJ family response regulator